MRALPGWAIILPEEKTKEGSLFLPDNAKTEMQRGDVFDVSYKEDSIPSNTTAIVNIRFKKGDRVVYKKYHDSDLEVDGIKYKVVPIEQVMVIL